MSLVVHDLSELKAEEAAEKWAYVANRLFAEQFHQNFYVKDLRSDVRLKYELHAYWEGRISEIHGWNDIIGQVVRPLKNFITNSLNNIWNSVIKPGVTAIIAVYRSIWNRIKSVVTTVYNKVVSVITSVKNIYDYVTKTIYTTLSTAYNFIISIPDKIKAIATKAVSVVWGWLVSVWRDYIKPGIKTIFKFYKAVWDNAVKFAQKAVTWAKSAWNAIQSAWKDVVSKVSGVFEAISKAFAALPQWISSAFQNAFSFFGDVLKGIWTWLVDHIVTPIKNGLVWIWNQLNALIDGAVHGIIGAITSLGQMNPDKAKSAIVLPFKLGLGAALGLGGMTLAGELLHPLKELGLGRISAMIFKFTQYDLITGAIVGALATAAYGAPLKYAFNEIFRPYLPNWRDTMELYSRGTITRDRVLQWSRYNGYPDEFMPFWDELKNSPTGYFGLAGIARTGYWNEEFFREELQRSGYSPTAQQAMFEMFRDQSNEPVRKIYSSTLMKRYQMGILNPEELQGELTMLQYNQAVKTALSKAAVFMRDTVHVTEMIKALQYSYRLGKITIEQFSASLKNLGLVDERVLELVAAEKARAKEELRTTQQEEVRAYGQSVVLRRYKEGIIGDKDLVDELRILGYTGQWIERLKVVAQLERDYDYATTVLRYTKTAYRKKKLPDSKFIEILKSYGFITQKIELELSLTKLAYGIGLTEEDLAS